MQTRPNEVMTFFEAGAKDALKMSLTVENRDVLSQTTIPDFQIILRSNQNIQSIRTLTAEHANTLIKVPGIIITSSKTRPIATLICIRCTKCQCVKVLYLCQIIFFRCFRWTHYVACSSTISAYPARMPLAGWSFHSSATRTAVRARIVGPTLLSLWATTASTLTNRP